MHKKDINYEAFMIEEVLDSRKKAYIGAGVATVIAILAMGTLFFLMPLKTVVPYVIKENVITGDTRIISALDKETLKPKEVTDKHFASDYIKKREQYYYDILEKDYYQVLLYSNESTQKEYQSIYQGEKSRDKILTNKYKVETTIISVVLSESAGLKVATIRSKNVTIDTTSLIKSNETYIVSTISYMYDPNKFMKEEDRLLNPLGFTVLTYRKDRETKQ